jgi:predicted N-acetyltransferase YhbS
MNQIMNAYNVEIRRLSDLTPDEMAEVEQVDRAAFGHGGPEFPQVKAWAQGEWLIAAKSQGQIVSQALILVREASVGGQALLLGGVGGVGTLPEKRGLGLAGAVMAKAGEFMQTELGVDFGLLVCVQERVALYSRSGWQVAAGPMEFDQPGGKLTWQAVTMILPCRRTDFPAGTIDLCGLPW